MYNIGIPEIICTKRYEDTEGISIRYDAEAATRPSICPDAAGDPGHDGHKLHVHSSKTNLLRDTRSEGKLVYINLTVKRYRCNVCGRIILDQFSFYDRHAHITNRLRNEFVDRCIKGETFSYIARDYGVNHKTVALAFKAYADAHKDLLTYEYTPEILGIDEAHIDDHYRLVLTDVKEQRLLDIKKDNKQRTLRAYLKTLDPTGCRCATMDFAPVYAQAVSTVLPDTIIVIDKFHVIQEINRCLDNVRKDLQNKYKAQGIDIRRFKKSKLLFMTNWEELTETGTDALCKWFDKFPELYEAYMCKETFRDIYLTADSYDRARELFDKWIDAIPDFDRFSSMKRTMTSRKEHVLNYWLFRWTNAYTESVNNLIKGIKKAGRGYKFDTLRERCLLEINSPKPKKFDPRMAEYIPIEEAGQNKRASLYNHFQRTAEYNQFPLQHIMTVYLDVNSSKNRVHTTLERIQAYCDLIQTIHH